jgi:hypothetical protein
MAWLVQRAGSAAISWGGGPEGRRWWAFVNLADRSPLFQRLRSHLKSLAPCAGSSWATGIQARPRAGTHKAATYCNPARRLRLRRTPSTEVTLGTHLGEMAVIKQPPDVTIVEPYGSDVRICS